MLQASRVWPCCEQKQAIDHDQTRLQGISALVGPSGIGLNQEWCICDVELLPTIYLKCSFLREFQSNQIIVALHHTQKSFSVTLKIKKWKELSFLRALSATGEGYF